ncbi:chlorophyllase/cutinase-like alpha/beta fold protein [Actinomadura flavalba]|uniref:poly(ethylene terephthalate) hydrolase family protein n=1 Tax=Actinomadura flavalba TaxID=1120938 RepID=UPI00037CDBFC|nr:alpha/beta hydrolase [Actinomadura flavalba]
MRARIAALVAVPFLGAGAFAVSSVAAGDPPAVRTVPAAAAAPVDWSKTGPHQVKVDKADAHTIYRPSDLGSGGVKNPVVIWGNGTGATPAAYDGLLRHWASHGFVVAAANTKQANNGNAMRAGLDLVTKWNTTSSSPYYGKVDVSRVASSGHSQGGAGAMNAAVDTRVDAVLPIQPGPLAAPRKFKQPTFYMAGQNDRVVWPSWVRNFYNKSGHLPAVFGVVRGATHVAPAGDGGAFRGPTTAWLSFTLRGDASARAQFAGASCGYCGASSPFSNWLRNTRFTSQNG